MWRRKLLEMLYKQYQFDPWVQALYQMAGGQLDHVEFSISDLHDQRFFDTATWGLAIYERALGITPRVGQTMEERRAVVQAKWLSGGKVDLALLQTIASAWFPDDVQVGFANGKITMTLCMREPTTVDMERLREAIETTKPAHLPISYYLRYPLRERAFSLGCVMGSILTTPVPEREDAFDFRDVLRMGGVMNTIMTSPVPERPDVFDLRRAARLGGDMGRITTIPIPEI